MKIVSTNVQAFLGLDALMASAPTLEPVGARSPRRAGSRTDAARARRPAAVGDGRQGHRRARPARQRQRVLRHRGHLAPERRRARQRRASGGRRPRQRPGAPPVHAVPRRRRRASSGSTTTTCTARPTSTSTRASTPSPPCSATLVPAVGHGRRRRADRRDARATGSGCFADWPPRAASEVMSAARCRQDRRRAGLPPPRRSGSPSRRWPRSRPGWSPGPARPT